MTLPLIPDIGQRLEIIFPKSLQLDDRSINRRQTVIVRQATIGADHLTMRRTPRANEFSKAGDTALHQLSAAGWKK
jgi:hypothetical protein